MYAQKESNGRACALHTHTHIRISIFSSMLSTNGNKRRIKGIRRDGMSGEKERDRESKRLDNKNKGMTFVI